ncbi:MAG: hypothetical protein JW891_07865 [Candidatus Lokiarchaeota archaeon]|nr:hypothetical protein [Candidatus Lokiarchaeota archaeon]
MTKSNDNKEVFLGLRNMVFGLNPTDIGISKETCNFPVWGIVMETGILSASYTLVVLIDGTTSLYFSNGGGILGGGEHEDVRKASEILLTGAQVFYEKGQETTKYPLPSEGAVNFYFLTFDGNFSYASTGKKLGKGNDAFSDLFLAAHGVITELRKFSESRSPT